MKFQERACTHSNLVHQLVEEQVHQTPEEIAVLFEKETLTFRELDRRAGLLADYLRSRGVRQNVFVGLVLERSLEMIVGILGVLKAGGVYVPMDPEHPRGRLEYQFQDSECAVILTQEKWLAELPSTLGAVYCLDTGVEVRPGDPGRVTPVDVPEPLTYMIYTSGTTGKPKGVMINHSSIVNLMHWMRATIPLEAGEAVLFKTTYSFDVSVQEIFRPLTQGGKLVVASPGGQRESSYLCRLIQDQKISEAYFVPSQLGVLVQDKSFKDCRSLRRVICAGEALPPGLVDQFYELLPKAHLINQYGPTEACVITSNNLILPGQDGEYVPIGEPISGVKMYVLGPDLSPLAQGEIGEIGIGGIALSAGYHRLPELTAQKFVTLAGQIQERVYRSGDLGKILPDGRILCLGRMDHQVKIRGYRIELGEIEGVLSLMPGVRQAVVLAVGEALAKFLVAFVKLDQEKRGEPLDFSSHLRRHLPEYMIPTRFLTVDEIPMTPNGKADRDTLVSLLKSEQEKSEPEDEPGTPMECLVAEVWRQFLGPVSLRRKDHFFEMGGNSLLAMGVVSRLEEKTGLRLSISHVFSHPTLAALAAEMEGQKAAELPSKQLKSVRAEPPYPATFIQFGMWVDHQIFEGNYTYNEPLVGLVDGTFDTALLVRALSVIMERHEILRTSLRWHEGRLWQDVQHTSKVTVPFTQVRIPETEDNWRNAIRRELALPIDLSRSPLWRCLLLTRGQGDSCLVFIFHHSIIDEWSLRVMVSELNTIAAAWKENRSPLLPGLSRSFGDFALEEQEAGSGAFHEKCRGYWTGQLSGFPPMLAWPGAKPGKIGARGPTESHWFKLSKTQSGLLRDLAARKKTTLFNVMLTLFLQWMQCLTEKEDVVVATPLARRDSNGWQGVMGCFIHNVPIRLRRRVPLELALEEVRILMQNSFIHGPFSIPQMGEIIGGSTGFSPAILYQTIFVLLEESIPALEMEGSRVHLEVGSSAAAKTDLIFDIKTWGEEWVLRFDYDLDRFDPSVVAQMADSFVQFCDGVMDSQESVRSEPVLIATKSGSRPEVLPTIHQVFLEQARATPDVVAVDSWDGAMTYGELADRAQAWTGWLQDHGVVPGDLVGLCVERTKELPALLLGILGAGGVYWALENNLPPSRFEQLVADAQPRLLLAGLFNDDWVRERLRNITPVSTGNLPVFVMEEAAMELSNPNPRPVPLSADAPAYVNYTSGSTGRPKGVLVPHRGVVRLVRGADYVSFARDEVFLHHSSLSFDASTFEIWGPLLNGGRLVLMPPMRFSPEELGAVIRSHKVTTLWLTAGLFHLIVEQHLEVLKPLRQLLAGGDVLVPELVRKALVGLPECRLYNGYGPTENTTFTTVQPITAETDLNQGVPIGRAIPGTSVYVLDEDLRPVPDGMEGELYAGGDGVALGYLNRPDLTEERFVPDPFSSRIGARMYRTGDLVRRRPDGVIEFVGRKDQQIKIRGFRVELGEIESTLMALPGVAQAAVVALAEEDGDKRLRAHLVFEKNTIAQMERIKERITETLPDYMRPSEFVVEDSLPLTPSGKVDRNALMQTTLSSVQITSSPTAPRNDLEWRIQLIWQSVLGRKDIGIHDNFFELGGHSFLAMSLLTKMEELVRRRLPLAWLFECPTIASLVGRFREDQNRQGYLSLVTLQPEGSGTPVYFVHGWGGDLFWWMDLAREMGPDRPVFGLRAVGLDDESPRHTSMEELVAHYASEIQQHHPKGPCHILGYSLGAWNAHALACELKRRGMQIGLLGLLDAEVLEANWNFQERIYHHGDDFKRNLDDFKKSLWKQAPRFKRWLTPKGFLQAAAKAQKSVATSKAPNEPLAPGSIDYTRDDYYKRIASRYRALQYEGDAVVFISEENTPERLKGWRRFIKGTVVYESVPGTHLQMLKPGYVETLATTLRRCLVQAESGKG